MSAGSMTWLQQLLPILCIDCYGTSRACGIQCYSSLSGTMPIYELVRLVLCVKQWNLSRALLCRKLIKSQYSCHYVTMTTTAEPMWIWHRRCVKFNCIIMSPGLVAARVFVRSSDCLGPVHAHNSRVNKKPKIEVNVAHVTCNRRISFEVTWLCNA